MDHLSKLRSQTRSYLFGVVMFENIFVLGLFWGLSEYTALDSLIILGGCLGLAGITSWILLHAVTAYITRPLEMLRQAILHLNPSEQGVAPPTPEKLQLGRELITGLCAQVFQLATVAEKSSAETNQTGDLGHNFIAQYLPLPLIVMDAAETIKFANAAAAAYIGIAAGDMIGKNAYMVLDMSFPSEETFDSWLKTVKHNNASASTSWERVRLNVRDDHPPHLFDLAAYYNRDNPQGNETMIILFDHTKQYSQDDQAVSFMALGVHELRTPLTLLRGYIEVFEEELGPVITDPELKSFMLKMHAMAEHLTAFVNNILNVARVDDDQLELKLQSEDWSTILKSSVEMMSLRAKVRGITLECHIARNLPPVGLDRLSIREVMSNLIDNAIKYSGTSKVIRLDTRLNNEGVVETTVQDFGLGIPSSILPNLFTKFYRDHRHRAQVGGTGLGLYLSKAIITAHGGSLWVRSKENEGSTFGFTLIPYAQLTEAMKQNGQQDITRSAKGWIKNHSLYRR